ncbi:hypothetical protein BDV96DRAFT_639770 [Lophiotrema nucula]|uniref:Uncharacterized protein n=1 Tax=Lophiotrema nucula TaxID=690887 RepID=A0A6A5ZUB0_9PLEO|nr:hypothetical protein BDV96DRAFT_639770 [Lophiotrema nucula]
MKPASILLIAAHLGLGIAKAIPTTALEKHSIEHPEFGELLGIQDVHDVEKRILDWSQISISPACWACLYQHAATIGFTLVYRRGSVPVNLRDAFLMAAVSCTSVVGWQPDNSPGGNPNGFAVYGPCGAVITATDPSGEVETMRESNWVNIIANS